MKYVLLSLMGVLGAQISYLGFGTENTRTEKFVKCQIETQMVEIQEGKLALNHGTSKEVRTFGEVIIKDHEVMLNDLKELAIAKNIVIPFQLPDSKTKCLTGLMNEKPENFDRKFVDVMVKDHKQDVSVLSQATHSKDPDIQAFAQQYLPIVTNHLTEAEDLCAKIKQPGS